NVILDSLLLLPLTPLSPPLHTLFPYTTLFRSTPLNAIIGFSEVLAQGMFGEINEKQTEYLHDILESGRHLLSLINDILDLSKIRSEETRLNSSHQIISYAVFCLKKKKQHRHIK